MPHNLDLHKQKKLKLIFASNPTRFPILNWQQEISYMSMRKKKKTRIIQIRLEIWRNKQELLFDLSKEVLVLSGNSENLDRLDYYKLNIPINSLKRNAGLPRLWICPDYLSNAAIIREHGLGFVVSSHKQTVVYKECTEEQYAQMVANTQYTAYLISNGYFHQEAFCDAIMALNLIEKDYQLSLFVLNLSIYLEFYKLFKSFHFKLKDLRKTCL